MEFELLSLQASHPKSLDTIMFDRVTKVVCDFKLSVTKPLIFTLRIKTCVVISHDVLHFVLLFTTCHIQKSVGDIIVRIKCLIFDYTSIQFNKRITCVVHTLGPKLEVDGDRVRGLS